MDQNGAETRKYRLSFGEALNFTRSRSAIIGGSQTSVDKIMRTCAFENPFIEKRKVGAYANVLIIKCSHDDWWYRTLVGETFFCELRFRHFYHSAPENHPKKDVPTLADAILVRLTGTKKEIFRSFHPDDIMIV